MKTLFTIVAMELFIGGGGRLTTFGPMTLRMVLFAVCLCCSVYFALYRSQKGDGTPLALALAAGYLLVHLPAVLIGVIGGSLPGDITTEMQQSLYWLAAPFFAVALRSVDMVARAALLVRLAGVVLASGYLLTLAGLAVGAVDFVGLYARLNATGEFFFRGESFFFYKGFLYLGIATVFLLAMKHRYSQALLMTVIAALILTLTRGFVLSTSLAILLMLVALGRWRGVALAAIVVAAAAFMVWIYLPSIDDVFLGQREASNSQRGDDIAYMLDNVKVTTLMFGSGFGSTINERINIENTYLWALWKLGIAGLCFWLLPLILSFRYYRRVSRKSPQFNVACAFFFGTVVVYVQTMTNPYLNNPIGLSFVLIALFSLRTLSRNEPQAIASRASKPSAAVTLSATPAP